MSEPILLTATRIASFDGARALTNASGFFFERHDKLFLVTSRHVLHDPVSQHLPDRLAIDIHTDDERITVADLEGMTVFTARLMDLALTPA